MAAIGQTVVKYPLDTKRNLMFRIMKLSSRLSATYAKIYVPRVGIGIPEWRLMAVLGFVGPLPLIRIAEHAAIDRGTITKAAERLRLQGVIDIRPDPKDSRKRIAALTPLGEKLHDRIGEIATARHHKLLEMIPAEEQAEMLEMLDKLDEALEKLDVYVPAELA